MTVCIICKEKNQYFYECLQLFPVKKYVKGESTKT